MQKEYKRLVLKTIENKLKTSGAVLVAGPKFSGKTTICMKLQNSFIKLNKSLVIESIEQNPEIALDGPYPHLIDEWQTVPDLWNYIKDDLDKDYQFGKYILTGSSTPADRTKIFHSGAGRIYSLKMKPLSLSESEESNKTVSLSKLFNKEQQMNNIRNDKIFDDVLFYMCRGGWPLSCLAETRESALEITNNYFENLFSFEQSKNEKFRNKKSGLLQILLKSCARHISSPIKATSIINDIIKGEDRESFNRKTYDDYMEALNDLFILDNIESWNPNLRSKTIITTSPILHFSDTSIACCALNATPDNLKLDIKTTGLLFEDFVIRDLSIYSELIKGKIKHYRDANGLECDAIITLPNGKWCAIEIKIGGLKQEQEAIKTLTKFINKVEGSNNYEPPTFSMVITAYGQPRLSKEGVFIVPITCLCE